MTKNELANIIYDTLAGNDNNIVIKPEFVTEPEIDNETNTITFKYGSSPITYQLTLQAIHASEPINQ